MYIEESIWGYVIMMVVIWSFDYYNKTRRNPDEV